MLGQNEGGPDLPNWVATGIVSLISSMGLALGFGARLFISQQAKQLAAVQENHTKEICELKTDRDALKIEAEECRKQREDLRVECASIRVEMDSLRAALSRDTTEA